MSDTDGKKNTRTGRTRWSGEAKLQPWAHEIGRGREKSAKRVVVPKAGAQQGAGAGKPSGTPKSDPSRRPAGISEAEMDRRLKALCRRQGARDRGSRRARSRGKGPRGRAPAPPRRGRGPRTRKSASAKPPCAPRKKKTPAPRQRKKAEEEARKARKAAPPPAEPAAPAVPEAPLCQSARARLAASRANLQSGWKTTVAVVRPNRARMADAAPAS